jgi:alpha-glucoside transport system permease protein
MARSAARAAIPPAPRPRLRPRGENHGSRTDPDARDRGRGSAPRPERLYLPLGAAPREGGTVNALLTDRVRYEAAAKAWLFDTGTNNASLITVGVWMWTGFAMVILSAGLKGIPTELIEAARIDGASELQVLRRITLPLLAPTMTVVATTLVIDVLKIFDVVYVMTNGNLGTDVIANRMYKEMFKYHNYGRASAIAVLILVVIAPVMIMNIKRFRQGG